MTGSFTGSLGGASADGVFSGKAKKRGRKSKAEKEREQREDAMSARGGAEARFGSVDADGQSVRGGGGSGGAGGTGGAGAGGAAGEEADDDEDFDDEGELLGREEGATDTEAEKKNLAYVLSPFFFFYPFLFSYSFSFSIPFFCFFVFFSALEG